MMQRERTGLFYREITYLFPAGTSELKKHLPSVLQTTEDGEGVDIVTYQEQGVFAVGWLKNATAEEMDIINKAIALHFHSTRPLLDKKCVIRLDFYVQDVPAECGKYVRDTFFEGGKVVHSNVALTAEEEDNWDILSIPVIVSIRTF